MGKSISGLLFLAVCVLAVVWGYNRFVADEGKTIADFGKPPPKGA